MTPSTQMNSWLVMVTVPCCDGWMETGNGQRPRLDQRAHDQLEVESARRSFFVRAPSKCLWLSSTDAFNATTIGLVPTREHRKRMTKDDRAPVIPSICVFFKRRVRYCAPKPRNCKRRSARLPGSESLRDPFAHFLSIESATWCCWSIDDNRHGTQ
jgi:hypothetical protein